MHAIPVISAALLSCLVAASCSSSSTNPVPDSPSDRNWNVRSFLFLRQPGSSYTLQYRTVNITATGEQTTTMGSAYRYTVLDTAFVRSTDGRRCVMVLRETMTSTGGSVLQTDTTYQFADASQLVVYERMSDTAGRRRLAEPLRTGTTFLYRDYLGSVESNIYHIISLDSTVSTVTGNLPAVHVRMSTSTSDSTGRTVFQDEQLFSPSIGVIVQRQTRRFTPADGGASTTTVLEFYLVQRSW